MLPRGSQIFELGMGTGYFGQFLSRDGYRVSGIQPADGMLARLRRDRPELNVVAEQYIQDYQFTEQHPAIVSHSSVFLFTSPDAYMQGQAGQGPVFQSFIRDEGETFRSMDKVMDALTPDGGLYINIQPNAKPFAQIDPTLSFEMTSCQYDFGANRVDKTFAITSNGQRKVLDPDISYVLRWGDFDPMMRQRGHQARVSDDGFWVVVSRGKRNSQ
jgi:hypothetical protein